MPKKPKKAASRKSARPSAQKPIRPPATAKKTAKPAPAKAPKAKPVLATLTSPAPGPAQNTQILTAASAGIVAISPEGIITLANPAAADLLNRDPSAMIGLSVERAFVYGNGHPRAGEPIPLRHELKKGPHHIDREVHLARTDGESFEAVYVLTPYSANRALAGYVLTLRDVTRRRRAEAELRLSNVVFEHSPEGLIVADAKGRVTKVNPSYRRIVSLEDGEIIGKNMNDILFMGAAASQSILETLNGDNEAQW